MRWTRPMRSCGRRWPSDRLGHLFHAGRAHPRLPHVFIRGSGALVDLPRSRSPRSHDRRFQKVKTCECGCGQPTTFSIREGGRLVRNRFVQYHAARTKAFSATRAQGENHYKWHGNEIAYSPLHDWVRRHKVKTGTCRGCGRKAVTQWANISGVYLRDLDDFTELCNPCHRELDSWGTPLLGYSRA